MVRVRRHIELRNLLSASLLRASYPARKTRTASCHRAGWLSRFLEYTSSEFPIHTTVAPWFQIAARFGRLAMSQNSADQNSTPPSRQNLLLRRSPAQKSGLSCSGTAAG